MIPYSAEVFFATLAAHNELIWPAQAVAFLIGAAALWVILAPRLATDKALAAVLALAWLWVAAVYFYREFALIDFWAYGFAAVFALQGLALAWSGMVRGQMQFGFEPGLRGWSGLAIAVFGLAGYPVASLALGRSLAETGFFATAPGPSVLFTLGALLMTRPGAPLYLFVLPLMWCAVAGFVASRLGIHEDFTLAGAGLVTLAALVAGRHGPRAGSDQTGTV